MVPWYKNAIVFAVLGLVFGGAIIAAEVVLLMRAHANGLPEAVTVGGLSLANLVIGYAGGCLNARGVDTAAE